MKAPPTSSRRSRTARLVRSYLSGNAADDYAGIDHARAAFTEIVLTPLPIGTRVVHPSGYFSLGLDSGWLWKRCLPPMSCICGAGPYYGLAALASHHRGIKHHACMMAKAGCYGPRRASGSL